MTSSTLLSIMATVTLFCFPVLMILVAVVNVGKKIGGSFLQTHPAAKRFYDRVVAMGPKEGWSGYVIGALALAWLAVMAAILLSSTSGSAPNHAESVVRAEMALVEMDDGGYGYISEEAANEAAVELIASGQVPGEAQIPAYSEDGEVVGTYTVYVEAG